jgi:mRNA interferase RelE/StbE
VQVADTIRRLPLDIKRGVKAALRAISADPDLGDALLRELAGLRKYRVRRFRIVFSVDRRGRHVQVMAVGERRHLYDDVAALLRREAPRHE